MVVYVNSFIVRSTVNFVTKLKIPLILLLYYIDLFEVNP